MAVPSPSAAAASSHGAKVVLAAIDPIAAAWRNIPATISPFRPTRSDKAPVPIWAIPQTAGYAAASTPTSPIVSPWAA